MSETCHYPCKFIRLKKQSKTTVNDNCKKINLIVRERSFEVVKTVIYAFREFYMFNCAVF